MGNIFIGTSGFSFEDWKGEVYPEHIKSYEMLPYYEEKLGFNTLEVNYTYYTLPSQKTMESFYRRTSKGFTFVVKAYKGLTHQRDDAFKKTSDIFKEGIMPLKEKLKAILFQFPYNFSPGKESIRLLHEITSGFNEFNVVIEFRNHKWFRDEYIELLRSLSLGFCVVDEPKIEGLMPFHPVLTSDTGYFRFHGRNKDWFKAPAAVRYDYYYTDDELKEFVSPIREISKKAINTFIYFNNCHLGKAVKNAHRLKELLEA
ncbi:MAG TPA: DUF72 domain-containing protein [Syntrophorhabdaceae bacterium]|nr:DUF72 domain-containing protein [Syntrophorhabdaceae bacterium]